MLTKIRTITGQRMQVNVYNISTVEVDLNEARRPVYTINTLDDKSYKVDQDTMDRMIAS